MNVTQIVLKAFAEDPEGGALLMDEVVSGYLAEQAEIYAAPLQAVIANSVAGTTAIAKRALARSYIEVMVSGHYPDDEVHKTAEWLAGLDAYTTEVLKAQGSETWRYSDGRTVTRNVKRDQGGRWTRTVDAGARTDIRSASRLSPSIAGRTVGTDASGKRVLAEGIGQSEVRRLNAHQGQWEQASNYARELASAWTGSSKDATIAVQVRYAGTGQVAWLPVPVNDVRRHGLDLTRMGDVTFDPLDDQILTVALEAAPGASEEGKEAVARFNAMGGMGGETMSRLGGTQGSDWAQALGRYDAETPGLTQLFARMRAGGDLLRAVGADKTGHFVNFVGTLGPEAEKVLGPHVRLAAYRYRGTEKTPDADTQRLFRDKNMRGLRDAADAGLSSRELRDVHERAGGARRGAHPVVGAATVRAGHGSTGDQLKLQTAADVAAMQLVRTLPRDALVAELSEKSGNVLPSQGLLIDSNGEIVSQAVGYADDHYLPFNLKHLAALRGGQYVRTRVAGGLTGEDIYASVQSGARMATVVSSSGVYSLEFDPAFRGARSSSDKARQMYGRYLKILDAVESSGLYVKDLGGPVKRAAAEDARLIAGPGASDADIKAIREQILETKRRAAGTLTEDEDAELYTAAKDEVNSEASYATMSNSQRARIVEDVYREKVEEATADKVMPLQLNAEGYKVALETLQSQFPYFIRNVSYEPLRTKDGGGFLADRGQDATLGLVQRSGRKDTGYVRPGGLRPASVRSGYYNPGSSDVEPKRAPKATEEPEAAPGGGAPTAAPGADAGVRAAGPAPGATGSKLGQKLSSSTGKTNAAVKTGAEELSAALHLLPGARDPGVLDKTWEEVAGKPLATEWLMAQPDVTVLEKLLVDPATREQAAGALSDPRAVERAFTAIWGKGFADNLGSAEMEGPGGATTLPEAVAWVTGMAQRVADTAMMGSEPFVPAALGPEAAWHTGPKPQAFPNLDLTDAVQIQRFAEQPEGARLQQVISDIGAVRPDGTYESASVVARNVKAQIDLLHRIESEGTALAREVASSRDPKPITPEMLANKLGVAPEVLAATFGPTPPAQINAQTATARAMAIQQAWSLVTAERAVQMLEGGDVHPKAGAGLFRRPVAKALSSPLAVLSLDDPAAVALVLKRAGIR